MEESNYIVKIGLFIFVGLVLLTVITFSVGEFLFQPKYTIKVSFNFADGIQESAPVRLAGVGVGEVKKVQVFKDPSTKKTKIRVDLELIKTAQVETDSKVVINTLGLIGEKYVEITPGTPGASLLRDGDGVIGQDSIPMQGFTHKVFGITVKLEEMIDSMNFVLDKIKSNEGTVGKLFMEDKIHRDLEEIIADIKEFEKDLKRNPWKILHKPRESRRKKIDDKSKDVGGI